MVLVVCLVYIYIYQTQVDLLDEEAIGPDAAELHANSAAYLLDSMQSRKSAGRAASVAAVPAGLEPEVHYEVGLKARSPLSMETYVPVDLDWADGKVTLDIPLK